MQDKKISSAVIRRLPRYYRYLGELMETGVQRISSKELSGSLYKFPYFCNGSLNLFLLLRKSGLVNLEEQLLI